jgi:hypothetical protein
MARRKCPSSYTAKTDVIRSILTSWSTDATHP